MEEKQLIERINSGEKELFRHFLNEYSNFVYSICVNILRNPEDARDVSQETFYKAYKALKKFDGSKSKFSTWLYKIAYNKCIDFIRKKNNFLNLKSYLKQKDIRFEYQKHQFENEIVGELLGELSERDSALITLYYLNELSVKEISFIIDDNENNIKVKLHRIRKELKLIANKKYNNELQQ
ncbi:MAG: RNA polymerase sigma factor [Candidatus Kapaibacterium sp.]|nr:RNA polymerase sigma factor [Ignavibacteriota bacterium]MCB9221194.1 RNA polymerase sigma factor [Ignavibacteria bacterium]